MSRVMVLLLFIVVVHVGSINAGIICPPNQVFKLCGTACEPRCGIPQQPNCISKCVTDCQCIDGYSKNSLNECVLPDEC
ncbi:chymotrypsin inhibitor-like [Bombus fervidus]|uniref:chymotrypsin inhibitor-like n=1 Tax=Bombus fervidus TaxID=203811 RepID=UPI003D18B174